MSQIDLVTRSLPENKGKAIVLFDGLPTIEHYLRQFLPIIALSGKFTTGWDGTISHVNAIPPEVWPLIFDSIFKSHNSWKAKIARERIQAPLGTVMIPAQVKITAY